MKVLLEFREKVRQFYAKTETFLIPIIRFIVAFIVLAVINSKMGYMPRVDNIAFVLIASLMCSFLPSGAVLVFAAIFSALHMYALSLETLAVGLVVYLLIYLLFLRFAPKESLVVALTPLLLCMKIPCVIPIVMGLVGTPASAVSVGCGVVAYYLLSAVVTNSTVIEGMADGEAVGQLKLIVDALIHNKQMLVMVIAFAITVIVVYVIRKLAIAHAWTLAIVAGTILDLIVLIIGNLAFDAGLSVGSIILSSFLAVIVGFVLLFFRFLVDYNRVERVTFEDDEYVYFVKAVPKMVVAKSSRKVKRINGQTHRRSVVTGRTDAYEEDGLEFEGEDFEGDGFGGADFAEDSYYQDDQYGAEAYEGDYEEPYYETDDGSGRNNRY